MNIYYQPNAFGLEVVAELEYSPQSYEFDTGNFENETIEITSLLNQGDVPEDVLKVMRSWTAAQLGIKQA